MINVFLGNSVTYTVINPAINQTSFSRGKALPDFLKVRKGRMGISWKYKHIVVLKILL